MPELKFIDAEIPDTTREAKPNPFREVVKTLCESGKAKAFVMPVKTTEDEKALKTAVTQIQSAGKEFGKSIRKTVARKDDKATVTVWAVERIERKRKDKDSEPATDASE